MKAVTAVTAHSERRVHLRTSYEVPGILAERVTAGQGRGSGSHRP